MNAFKTILLLTFLTVAATATATATDWPLHFDAILKDRYILVVLHEGGRAQYFDRIAQKDAKGNVTGDVFIQHDDDATWGSAPEGPQNKGVLPEVSKNGKPFSSLIYLRTNQFCFHYYYQGEQLTEVDKMGKQSVLPKRKNTNQKRE